MVHKDALCLICNTSSSELTLGDFIQKDDTSLHLFCVLSADSLQQSNEWSDEYIYGFKSDDIRQYTFGLSEYMCSFCSLSGAANKCFKCNIRFHLPCGLKNNCLTQLFGCFPSFCSDHKPVQILRKKTISSDICPICTKKCILDSSLYLSCCCKNLVHIACLRELAFKCKADSFKCPICSDCDHFQYICLRYGGVYLPDVLSNENENFAKPSKCSLDRCLCLRGINHVEEQGPWKLYICQKCRVGVHQGCVPSHDPSTAYICNDCFVSDNSNNCNNNNVFIKKYSLSDTIPSNIEKLMIGEAVSTESDGSESSSSDESNLPKSYRENRSSSKSSSSSDSSSSSSESETEKMDSSQSTKLNESTENLIEVAHNVSFSSNSTQSDGSSTSSSSSDEESDKSPERNHSGPLSFSMKEFSDISSEEGEDFINCKNEPSRKFKISPKKQSKQYNKKFHSEKEFILITSKEQFNVRTGEVKHIHKPNLKKDKPIQNKKQNKFNRDKFASRGISRYSFPDNLPPSLALKAPVNAVAPEEKKDISTENNTESTNFEVDIRTLDYALKTVERKLDPKSDKFENINDLVRLVDSFKRLVDKLNSEVNRLSQTVCQYGIKCDEKVTDCVSDLKPLEDGLAKAESCKPIFQKAMAFKSCKEIVSPLFKTLDEIKKLVGKAVERVEEISFSVEKIKILEEFIFEQITDEEEILVTVSRARDVKKARSEHLESVKRQIESSLKESSENPKRLHKMLSQNVTKLRNFVGKNEIKRDDLKRLENAAIGHANRLEKSLRDIKQELSERNALREIINDFKTFLKAQDAKKEVLKQNHAAGEEFRTELYLIRRIYKLHVKKLDFVRSKYNSIDLDLPDHFEDLIYDVKEKKCQLESAFKEVEQQAEFGYRAPATISTIAPSNLANHTPNPNALDLQPQKSVSFKINLSSETTAAIKASEHIREKIVRAKKDRDEQLKRARIAEEAEKKKQTDKIENERKVRFSDSQAISNGAIVSLLIPNIPHQTPVTNIVNNVKPTGTLQAAPVMYNNSSSATSQSLNDAVHNSTISNVTKIPSSQQTTESFSHVVSATSKTPSFTPISDVSISKGSSMPILPIHSTKDLSTKSFGEILQRKFTIYKDLPLPHEADEDNDLVDNTVDLNNVELENAYGGHMNFYASENHAESPIVIEDSDVDDSGVKDSHLKEVVRSPSPPPLKEVIVNEREELAPEYQRKNLTKLPLSLFLQQNISNEPPSSLDDAPTDHDAYDPTDLLNGVEAVTSSENEEEPIWTYPPSPKKVAQPEKTIEAIVSTVPENPNQSSIENLAPAKKAKRASRWDDDDDNYQQPSLGDDAMPVTNVKKQKINDNVIQPEVSADSRVLKPYQPLQRVVTVDPIKTKPIIKQTLQKFITENSVLSHKIKSTAQKKLQNLNKNTSKPHSDKDPEVEEGEISEDEGEITDGELDNATLALEEGEVDSSGHSDLEISDKVSNALKNMRESSLILANRLPVTSKPIDVVAADGSNPMIAKYCFTRSDEKSAKMKSSKKRRKILPREATSALGELTDSDYSSSDNEGAMTAIYPPVCTPSDASYSFQYAPFHRNNVYDKRIPRVSAHTLKKLRKKREKREKLISNTDNLLLKSDNEDGCGDSFLGKFLPEYGTSTIDPPLHECQRFWPQFWNNVCVLDNEDCKDAYDIAVALLDSSIRYRASNNEEIPYNVQVILNMLRNMGSL